MTTNSALAQTTTPTPARDALVALAAKLFTDYEGPMMWRGGPQGDEKCCFDLFAAAAAAMAASSSDELWLIYTESPTSWWIAVDILKALTAAVTKGVADLTECVTLRVLAGQTQSLIDPDYQQQFRTSLLNNEEWRSEVREMVGDILSDNTTIKAESDRRYALTGNCD